MQYIKKAFNALIFLIINLVKIPFIGTIVHRETENLIYTGLDKYRFSEFVQFYENLSGHKLNILNRIIFKIFSEKLVVSVIDKRTQKIVAVHMSYINYNDIKSSTIHATYMGVLEEFRGHNIARAMREVAIETYKNYFNGMSTRISKNNLPSLKSAEKVGYKIKYSYIDKNSKEERCYLINQFN